MTIEERLREMTSRIRLQFPIFMAITIDWDMPLMCSVLTPHATRFVEDMAILHLVIKMRVHDRMRGQPISLTFTKGIPVHEVLSRGQDHLDRWTRETLREAMTHELDEMLLIDDCRKFDPHRSDPMYTIKP